MSAPLPSPAEDFLAIHNAEMARLARMEPDPIARRQRWDLAEARERVARAWAQGTAARLGSVGVRRREATHAHQA